MYNKDEEKLNRCDEINPSSCMLDDSDEDETAINLFYGDVDGESENEYIEDKNDSACLRRKKTIKRTLHSRQFQIVSIALVVIDCLLVFTEIILDLYFSKNKDENHDEDEAKKLSLKDYLSFASLGLLSLFVLERIVKIIVDFHHFFTHKMEVFDAVVVFGSFTVDVAVISVGHSDGLGAIGLLVILRLWRVIRIINGIIVSSKKAADKRVHFVKSINRELQFKIDKMQSSLEDQRNELLRLTNILEDHGIKCDVNMEIYNNTIEVKT